jgi:hypothetical protein
MCHHDLHDVPIIPALELNIIDQFLETTLLTKLCDFTALLQVWIHVTAKLDCVNNAVDALSPLGSVTALRPPFEDDVDVLCTPQPVPSMHSVDDDGVVPCCISEITSLQLSTNQVI